MKPIKSKKGGLVRKTNKAQDLSPATTRKKAQKCPAASETQARRKHKPEAQDLRTQKEGPVRKTQASEAQSLKYKPRMKMKASTTGPKTRKPKHKRPVASEVPRKEYKPRQKERRWRPEASETQRNTSPG